MSSIWERFCRKLFRPVSCRKPHAPRFAKPRLEILEDRTLPSTFVFTNAAGGGGWNTPGNWAVGGVGTLALPGPTDDASIGAIGGVIFAVVLAGSSATVNSVGLGTGCSLTVNSALEPNGIATDPVSVFQVTTSTQPAEVKIDQSATFSGSVIDAGRIIAKTTNPFTGTGVTFAGGAVIGPGDLNGNLVAGPNSSFTFTSTGEFATGATFGIGSGSIIVAAGVAVDGSLDVNNETLVVAAGGTLGGPGSVTVNSNLNWTGGAITVAGGVTALTGPVTTSGGGSKTLGTTLTNENPLTNLGGTGGLSLTTTGSIVNTGNATINLSLPFITPAISTAIGITNTAGSTLDVTAPASAATVISVPFVNDGFLKVESSDSLVLSTTAPGAPADTLDGVLQLIGNLTLLGAFTSVTGFMLQADPGFLEVGSPSGGPPTTLTVPGGVIDTLDGNLAVNSGSTLTGGGQIINAGRLELEFGSSTLGLGSYVQTSIGTLALAEMGPTSASLVVTGTAQLSGTLVLMGPPPPVGTAYTVVRAGRVSGHFDTIPNGMSETDMSTSVTVTQVRPPA